MPKHQVQLTEEQVKEITRLRYDKKYSLKKISKSLELGEFVIRRLLMSLPRPYELHF